MQDVAEERILAVRHHKCDVFGFAGFQIACHTVHPVIVLFAYRKDMLGYLLTHAAFPFSSKHQETAVWDTPARCAISLLVSIFSIVCLSVSYLVKMTIEIIIRNTIGKAMWFPTDPISL